jgi:TonB family protein
MSILVKLCFASLIVGSMIPGASLASLLQSSRQQTAPTTSADADKQPEIPAKPLQPRPNPDASGKYHVGDGVTAPKLIYQVEPEFSEKARKQKVAGATRLAFIVETDGHVRDIRVTKSCADAFTNKKDREAALTLDQKAINAASQYLFEPARYQDKPVPVEFSAEINFQVF